jgi:RHS repeat-associated protein
MLRTGSVVGRRLAVLMGALILTMEAAGLAFAQPLPTVQWHLRQGAEERLTVFGEDMFGDQIDPHTGGISFLHTDVSLPGNSGLDVSISRRRIQGVLPAGANADFGDWELLVPRIKLTTAYNRPWTGNRCSNAFATSLTGVIINGHNNTRMDYSNGATVEVGSYKEQLLESPSGAQWPVGTTHVTKGNWRFTCGSASDGGQGFIGKAPNGDTYRFDRVIVLDAEPLDIVDNLDLERDTYVIAATEVTDVNGNWVQYTYNVSGQLTQIQANDGRLITLAYWPSTNIIQSVTANGRTWTYAYAGLNYTYPVWKDLMGIPAPGETLTQVTLPDSRQWQFSFDGMAASTAPAPGCWETYTISVTHPAGATATFDLSMTGHRYWLDRRVPRSGGNRGCPMDYGVPQNGSWPIRDAASTQVMSVIEKEVTGPSIPTTTWTYEYENDLTTNTSAGDPTNWTKVTGPGVHITYIHSWGTQPDGGALLRKEVRATAGGPLLEQVEYGYVMENAVGNTAHQGVIAFPGNVRRAQYPTETKITRGTDWWRTVNAYDNNFASATYSFGNPLTVTKDSNVSTTARVHTTAYIHDKPIWVLGLPDTTSVNGRAINKFYYDALSRKTAEDLYGVRVADYAYHTSAGQMGAIHWFKDALNRTTYANNWKRGSPQQITLPDSSNVYQTIDNNGWLTSTTDAKGFVTSYGRDSMGRLTSYTPTGWTPTTHSYSFSASGAVQTITKGSGQTTVTYDNRWQPKLVKTQDTGTGWTSYVNSTFDPLGRVTFASYPSTSSTSTAGLTTTYDALGRTLTTTAPGSATSTFQYLNGHIRRVIDPAGNQTDSYFTGYDGPDSKEVVRILQPLTTNTYINRNVWGEIDSVRQVGTQNGYTVDFTQYHYYDTQRRRCRYVTPEGGHTLFAYNNANEMTSYEKGASSGTACTAPSGTALVSQSYDLLGRLTTTNFADAGTPDVTRGYDANGNITSLVRGGTNWTYDYNALNLLEWEQLVIDGRTYLTDYGYNANGHLSATVFPGGPTVMYAPDGLGRATQAVGSSNYATGLQYHPNNALSAFTYGNGYMFGQTLNTRQMPQQVTSVLGGTKAADLTFGYTLNDQINAITDAADPGNNRTFTYDGLGRLLTSTGQWGSGAYVYDAVGNLRQRTEGARVVQTQYDASNRLSQMRDTATGNIWRTYTYDGRGSVTYDANTQHTIGYDYGDQPVSLSGPSTGSYVYDGNFKRAKQVVNGKTVYSVYGKSGALLHRDDITTPKRVSFVQVGGKTIAEVTIAGVATYFHNDQLGSPVSSTNAGGTVLWREQYTPYGESLQNDAAHSDGIGFTGHVEDATGLTYMQARYYDPVVGRFLAIDPVEFSGEKPDMFNRYAYGGGNPVNGTDPDGKQIITNTNEWWNVILRTPAPKPSVDDALNAAQGGLDGAGFTPAGPIADGLNALIHALRGNGEEAYWSMVGMVPAIGDAAKAARMADRAFSALADGGRIATNDALEQSLDVLGPNYKEVAPGVFRSADGQYQVRMTDSDLAGRGTKGEPHINVERGSTHTDAKGREVFVVQENKHVIIDK